MYDLPLHLWYSITRLGGAGLTLPLALTIGLWLALGYTWRLALAWLGLLAGAVGIVALTKIAFLGWGVGVRAWDFTGVSGHAMLSTAVSICEPMSPRCTLTRMVAVPHCPR